MRKFAVALTLFSASFSLAAPTVNDCRRFFNYPDGTNALIGYIEAISEIPEITSQLNYFYQKVINGEIVCPISRGVARVNPELQIHRTGINKILEQSSFDMSRLMAWATKHSSKRVDEQHERREVETLTIKPVRDFKMVRINQIQPSIMMMNGPVTEMMWAQIFEKMPIHISKDPGGERIKVGQKNIYMFPNHPITGITYWSAVVFANQMSKRLGLPEAYDLSNVVFTAPNSKKNRPHTPQEILVLAAKGELIVLPDDSKSLQRFQQNNTEDVIIQRPGLRLPTKREFAKLAYELAQYGGSKVENLSDQQIEHMFCSGSMQRHPVGDELEPAIIDSQIINDLLGHIYFITNNLTASESGERWQHYYLGAAHNASVKDQIAHSSELNGGGGYVGLFLVRTVQP